MGKKVSRTRARIQFDAPGEPPLNLKRHEALSEREQFIRSCVAWERETQVTRGVLSCNHLAELAMQTCALIFNHPLAHESSLVTSDHWRRWMNSVCASSEWSPNDHLIQQACEGELRAALAYAPFDSTRTRLRGALARFTCVNALRMDLYAAKRETAVR